MLFRSQLYYNLGPYSGNSGITGGNNYEACIITAQNAIRDFPLSKHREELAFLVLKAKYQMSLESIEEKKAERLRSAADEFYAFKNDFPESKYLKEAERIMREVTRKINKVGDDELDN